MDSLQCKLLEQELDMVFKSLFETPTIEIWMPRLQPQTHDWFQLPANVHPRRQQMMAQTVGCLHLQVEFQASGPGSGSTAVKYCPSKVHQVFKDCLFLHNKVHKSFSKFLLQPETSHDVHRSNAYNAMWQKKVFILIFKVTFRPMNSQLQKNFFND